MGALRKPSVQSNLEQPEGELSIVEVVAQPVAIPDHDFLRYPRTIRTTTCKLVHHERKNILSRERLHFCMDQCTQSAMSEQNILPALKLAVRRPYPKCFCASLSCQ